MTAASSLVRSATSCVSSGRVDAWEDFGEMGRDLGMEPGVLVAAIMRCKADAAQGTGSLFHKSAFICVSCRPPPYVAIDCLLGNAHRSARGCVPPKRAGRYSPKKGARPGLIVPARDSDGWRRLVSHPLQHRFKPFPLFPRSVSTPDRHVACGR